MVACTGQTGTIELINSEGENLITYKTCILENIKVFKGEIQVNNFANIPGANTIPVAISGATETNTSQVALNNTENDSQY